VNNNGGNQTTTTMPTSIPEKKVMFEISTTPPECQQVKVLLPMEMESGK